MQAMAPRVLAEARLAGHLRCAREQFGAGLRVCRTQTRGARKMSLHRRFGTVRGSTTVESKISKMLSDLVLACQQIEADIAAEEQRTGIFDRSDARYPILARSLNERRGNLKGTIATLEKRVMEKSRLNAA
ncbi:hypothetical protein [Bradyrhizobium sp. CCBAU 51753]|uniref:hypothetical protein n=1 Tax=Bradyrhizobium sp. CCBAU 51753 TaxID=1325100 RepID=UPI001FED7BD5|nr:hypothetical protein [Bradyrhizobium sp. CCBAU 51753]